MTDEITLDADRAFTARDQIQAVAAGLASGRTRLDASVRSLLGAGWSGAAAEAYRVGWSDCNDATTFRNSEGKIVWLEKGNGRAGLEHIVARHGAEFAQKGIDEADLPGVLRRALQDGKIVGHQGKTLDRPIVGANPA